jgi:hypothetical protein
MPLDAQDKTTMEGLEERFTYHAPQGDQVERYQKIRTGALDLAKLIVANCPSCSERSTALTCLDEVVFFTNAAVARHG